MLRGGKPPLGHMSGHNKAALVEPCFHGCTLCQFVDQWIIGRDQNAMKILIEKIRLDYKKVSPANSAALLRQLRGLAES